MCLFILVFKAKNTTVMKKYKFFLIIIKNRKRNYFIKPLINIIALNANRFRGSHGDHSS